ncbi:hypothetical protein TVAG_310900 [Trichomonas vaginalis G3]|uniref:Bap-like n=1 Tax=Trichomonas vaginalis (strain ATCC PRA-98 / G3) TaxID=412133 RepID=A2FHU5_TRIV3|nr:hypothetical protein TVAGG3_0780480 [Trichomonas vaginalis G3]EAX95518.1 hypothetical protein TVAG_310900 [Trichomonas vaginalis G3]KAI5495009.1 hypothetical protein TVAGG3_0780480 [Trichomonas vaginalis G3]|eukprot:XP_001308448.1 hypothetical protein [Trichomonas vaginalis G3]
MEIDSLTGNDGYLLFIIQNKNTTHPKTFSLGACMNIGFLDNLYDNTITPFDSKPESGTISPGIYNYYIDSNLEPYRQLAESNGHKDYMKMVFDHLPWSKSFTDKRYIKPDRFWYGNYRDGYNDFFQQMPDDKKIQVKDSKTVDVGTGFSCNNIEIPADGTKILATHIYAIMEKPLDIMAEKQLVTHKVGEKINITVWMRLTDNSKRYDFGCINTNDENDKVYLTNKQINWRNDRATLSLPQKSEAGDYYYKCYIQEHDKPDTRSNEITVHATVSQPPDLVFNSEGNPQQDATFNQTDNINLKYTLTAYGNVTVYADCYKKNAEYKIDSVSKFIQTQSTNRISIKDTISFPVSKIQSSGQYTLRVYAKNSMENPSAIYSYNFIMDWTTYVSNIEISPTKLAPGESFTITGQFKDQDQAQKITFYTTVGQQFHSDEYTQTGSSQTFTINAKVPENFNTEGNQQFELNAKDRADNYVYRGHYNLSINKKPVLTLKPLKLSSTEVTEYSSDELLQLNVTVSDFGQGKINSYIPGTSVSGYIGYNPTAGSTQAITLAVNLNDVPYRAAAYTIFVKAQDDYGLPSNEETHQFIIRNKPNIVRIENFPERVKPKDDIQFKVVFTDKDAEKELFLMAQIDGQRIQRISSEEIKAPGPGVESTANINYYQKLSSGTHTIVFFLSSSQNQDSGLSPSANSNNITKTLHVSKAPEFKILNTGAIYAGAGERIEIKLSINDDGQGKIGYDLDGRTDFDTAGLKTTYTSNKDWTLVPENFFTVPQWCEYNNGNPHVININVKDSYDMPAEQNPQKLSFRVINTPNLVDINSNVTKLKSDTAELRTVRLTARFKDLDKGKELYFFVKEGKETEDRFVQPAHHMQSAGGPDYQTVSFDYEIQTTVSNENLKLVAWIDDDNDPASGHANGVSNKQSATVSISESPSIESACPTGEFGYNDKFNINYVVRDDGSGGVRFWLDDEKIGEDIPYSTDATTKLSKSYNYEIQITKHMTLGEHNISYYPVDSFGNEAPLSKRKICPFIYKSKPKLKNVMLNATQIDDDEIVIVNGTLEDYDNSKKLYIYQQIDTQTPILIGEAISNSGEQFFQFPLQNLVSQPSGHKTIYIFAADQNTSTTFEGNSKSDPVGIPLTFVNDPMFTVEVPNGHIYPTDEEFPIIVNITTDLPCTLTIKNYYDEYTYNFTKPTVHKQNISIKASYTNYFVFTLTGPNFTKPLTHRETFIIKTHLEIRSVKPEHAAATKEGVTFTFDVAYSGWSVYSLYYVACYTYNNKEYINVQKRAVDWYTNEYDVTFPIDIGTEKEVTVTLWV